MTMKRILLRILVLFVLCSFLSVSIFAAPGQGLMGGFSGMGSRSTQPGMVSQMNFIKDSGSVTNIHTVTYSVQGQGKLIISGTPLTGSGTYSSQTGTTMTISAEPTNGYILSSLLVNGAVFTSGGSYTIQGDVSIQAVFQPDPVNGTGSQSNPHTIQTAVSPSAGGTILLTGSNGQSLSSNEVADGEVITITAQPETGYQLESLMVNGSALTNGSSYLVKGDLSVQAFFSKEPQTYKVYYAQQPNGAIQVTDELGLAVGNGGSIEEGKTITIIAAPESGYTTSFIKVNNVYYYPSAMTNQQVQIQVTEDTTISGLFSRDTVSASPYNAYYAVTIPNVTNAAVTASVSSSTPFYSNSDGTGSESTFLSEGNTKYVLFGTVVTFNITTDSYAYNIDQLTNTAGSGAVLKDNIDSRQETLYVTVTQDISLGVTLTSRSITSSSSGLVYAPIAVEDEDGERLEDNNGDVFVISQISSDGRITLDGIEPGQTFYIKLGEIGFDPVTYLDCDDGYSHYAAASDLVDDDLFRISIDKSGDGKSLISSITQVSEKNLDGTRGSYLKVQLKDSTTTEELKASAEITFKARNNRDSGEDGNYGEWCSGDTAVLNLVLWINNSEVSDSAELGDRIYINPEDNEYNTFVWGDDRAALEFYADDDADAFYARLSTKSDIDIYTEYGDPVDADLWFYNFVGNPEIPSTFRAYLTLGIPWDDDDDYDPENVYIYQLESDGTLTDITDRFVYSEDSYEIPGWTIRTRVLGTYIVSDTQLDLESDYEVDYEEEAAEEEAEYEDLCKLNPVTGGGDYYYTPVAEPENYSISNMNLATVTEDGEAQEQEETISEEEDPVELNDADLGEVSIEASETAKEENTNQNFLLGLLLTGAAILVMIGCGYLFYRLYKKNSY